MHRLVKWGIRGFLLFKLLKIVSDAQGRSTTDNLKALASSAKNAKGALVSLNNITSAGAAINPAKQQARDAARAQVPVARAAATAVLGYVGSDALRIGNWLLRESDAGALVAVDQGGTETELVPAPAAPGGDPAADTGDQTATNNADTGKGKK